MDSLTVETARLRLIEEMLERVQEELEWSRPATATEAEQRLFYPRNCEIPNYGYDDPPPSYDQVCKDDAPPPLYETLGYGTVMANSGAETRSSTMVNDHAMRRILEPSIPSYSANNSVDSRSTPPREDSITEVTDISTTLQQIQNNLEEVRERFSQSDVDLFISSLSMMTPLLPSPTEHRAAFRL